MQPHAYNSRAAGGSSQPSYPPVAPSSPYYQRNQPQRRYSGEPSYPPSQAGSSSSSAYGQPSRSPLSGVAQHAQNDSDEYEERCLGEIAAANQAAQEQHWGPHAALSEAPACHKLYQEQNYMDRHYSMPLMPSCEPSHYDGGVYMQPSGMYESAPRYRVSSSYAAPSMASSQTLGGRSRQSVPLYTSPSMHYSPVSPISPASEPPNMFNVSAAHHMPGGWPGARDPLSGDFSVQPGALVGDPLPGFPNWSHTWYGGHLSADGHAYTMVPPQSGQSGWESETLSHGRFGPLGHANGYGAYAHDYLPTKDQVKEERIRMLEKEFGSKVKRKARRNADGDDGESQEPEAIPIGGVNDKGRLVLPWPKTRTTTRWLQCLVSLTGAACGIGGFIFIHPKDKAPPSGTMPSFVLYGVSAIATIACLWLFVFKRCCKSSRDLGGAGTMGAGGGVNGMVIPVMAGGSGGGAAKGLFGKNSKNMRQGTTVNLIVDPSLLGKHAGDSDSDSDGDEDDDADSEADRKRSKRRARRQKRMGMLENMKRQARWHAARTRLKWECAWDVVLFVLWGAAAVMAIGVGKKCPSGSAEGWCNLYNGAIACAVVATVLGSVAMFCDITALQASKSPPKSRA